MYVRENQSFTCPNPKCKRAFADPLFVENLSSEKTTSYFGCPYCLTEIKEAIKGEEKEKLCSHKLGYLSEHSGETGIPEQCMTCKKLIECMLFKLKKSDIAIQEIQKWYE